MSQPMALQRSPRSRGLWPAGWLLAVLVAGWGVGCEACNAGQTGSQQSSATASAQAATSATALTQSPPSPGSTVQLGDGYLVLAPRAYQEPLAPLLEHRRKQGHDVRSLAVEDVYVAHSAGKPDAHALRVAIRELWKETNEKLGFVLLVGDVQRPDETAVERLPTFYLPKVEYQTHDHNHDPYRHRSLLHPPHSDHLGFPTDHPYALLKLVGEGGHDHPGHENHADTIDLGGRADLAVGRLPARSAPEVGEFVAKLIAYEQGDVTGDWSRRLVVFAGTARFSKLIDSMIESTAVAMLDRQVPYDYDLRLIFAKPGSEYAYRFDRLGDKLVEEANHGALFLVYAGHASPAYLDSIEYRGRSYLMGSRREFQRMAVASRAPVFLALCCDAGGFDMSSGRLSIAEAAVINPRGPIASFAATRESHPYPNLLYGEAIIAQFLAARPRTLGEGIVAAKADMQARTSLVGERLSMVDGNMLKQEHAALYLLFGDPATRLRYPAAATVGLAGPLVAGGSATATVRTAAMGAGRVTFTLETRRTRIAHRLTPASQLDQLPLDEAFEGMAQNHALAMDKVLHTAKGELRDGEASVPLPLPPQGGAYVVKALVEGKAASGTVRIVAVGHLPVRVAAK